MSSKPKSLRIERSPKQGGTFVTTDSLHEAVKQVADHCRYSNVNKGVTGTWHGRKFNGWHEIEKAFLEPWKEGLKKVEDMLEAIRAEHLPEPTDMRRRNRWNELDGEIEVDRVMTGEPEYMRRAFRLNASAPRNVAILCNVGNTANFSAEQIFWRGAAAIAAIDLLENAGYQCEVWAWNHALNCFYETGNYYRRNTPEGYYTWSTEKRNEWDKMKKESRNEKHPQGGSSFFFCAKLKECGDPLDVDRLTNGLSAWFFRSVIFGMRDVVKRGSYGSGGSQHVMGNWIEKMDVSEGMTKVEVPSVFDKAGAIEAAVGILDSVTNRKPLDEEK